MSQRKQAGADRRVRDMPVEYDAQRPILCDVNVLINAAIATAEHHQVCADALHLAIAAGRCIATNATLSAGMVRIVSHPKIFQPPMHTALAFDFLSALAVGGRAIALEPGAKHWPLFQRFVREFRLSAGGVMDAWFAALAIEHDAEWWTCDAGFAKYPGLRLRNLRQAPSRP